MALMRAFDRSGQSERNAAETGGRHRALAAMPGRSHGLLRRGLQQLFQLLLVEFRVAGGEMAARLGARRDQDRAGRS